MLQRYLSGTPASDALPYSTAGMDALQEVKDI